MGRRWQEADSGGHKRRGGAAQGFGSSTSSPRARSAGRRARQPRRQRPPSARECEALRKPFLRPGALVRTLRAGLVRLVARARARRRRRSIAGPRRGRRRGRRRRGLTIDRALARATGLMVAVAVPTSRRAQRRPVVIHAVHAECGNPTISCEVCLNARVAWSSGDERRAALRRIAAPPRRRAARERAVRLPPSRPVSALPPCCSGRGGGANDTWKRLP